MQFNFNRYIQLIKSDLRGFRQKYLGIILAIFLYELIAIFLAFPFVDAPLSFSFWSRTFVIILAVIAPFLFYDDLYHKKKGVAFILLPASTLEKFFSALTHCVIILPLVLMFVTFTTYGFLDVFGIREVMWDFSFFFSKYTEIIVVQSFFFLMVFWFRKNKKRNTLLVLLGLWIVMVTTLIILASFGVFEKAWDPSFYLQVEFFNTQVVEVMSCLLFLFAAWFFSYYKFIRQQI